MERGDTNGDTGTGEGATPAPETLSDATVAALGGDPVQEEEVLLATAPDEIGGPPADRDELAGNRARPGGDLPDSPAHESRRETSDTPGRPEAVDTVQDSQIGGGAARAERDRVLERLDEVARQLDDLRAELAERQSGQAPAALEEAATVAEIRQEVRELRQAVIDLAGQGTGQEPALAAAAAAQQAAVTSDVKAARKRFRATAAWTRIWEALKKVAPHLWTLITKLTRVKEWSVTGQLGSNVLGFGSAGITVTFG
jgi:hypothetical protein